MMKLKTYVEQERGRLTELAKALDVVPSLVSMWATGNRKVPMEWCLEIEHLTAGQVTAEELRPDVKWTRFRKPKRA